MKFSIVPFSKKRQNEMHKEGWRTLYYVIWQYLKNFHIHSFTKYRHPNRDEIWVHCKCMNYSMKLDFNKKVKIDEQRQ